MIGYELLREVRGLLEWRHRVEVPLLHPHRVALDTHKERLTDIAEQP